MGFFTNLKSALESKRNGLGKVNTYLTNSEWSKVQRQFDDLEKEAESVFVYNPEVMQHQETCKAEVEDYKTEVVNIKSDCIKEVGDAVGMVNYAKVSNAKDFNDVSNKAVDMAQKAVGKARVEMEKASGNALKRIVSKLKSVGIKKNSGVDLRPIYEKAEKEQEDEKKKDELNRMEQNFALSREAMIQRANREGMVREHNRMITDLTETHKNIKVINESQEINVFLKNIPLEKLSEINRKITEVVPHALMLEADAKGRDLSVTREQIEIQGEKVKKLADEVNDKMNAASVALEIQRSAMKEFDKVRTNPDIRETYTITDMQTIGMSRWDVIPRANCMVMFSQAMQEEAMKNGGKGSAPAVFVVDHNNGAVHTYDTFEACDNAKNIGLTNPEKYHALFAEGSLQAQDPYKGKSFDGRVEAYFNVVRDFIMEKDRENQLLEEATRIAGSRSSVLSINHDVMELSRMKNEREAQESLSPYMYKENFDFLDAPSRMQETIAPLLISITKDMEAREQKDAFMSGSTLLARDSMKEGPNGQEFEQVLVLSVSIEGRNKQGQATHPTMNIVCNENGEFQAAYFSEELHYATASFLGNKIADVKNGIDYSYYSNNPIVRDFLESFESVRTEIESHCDASKFYEDRNITLEDIKKAQEAIELDGR